MTTARLLAIEIERFKSYRRKTRIDLPPLTILLGRNNSGKSSIIQALLLLKQTLTLPRPEVPLHLEGVVDALSLRELTSGWPTEPEFQGPSFGIEWTSSVDTEIAREQAKNPDVAEFRKNTGLPWPAHSTELRPAKTRLKLDYSELHGKTILRRIELSSLSEPSQPTFTLQRQSQGEYSISWKSRTANGSAGKLNVELDHFLPYLLIERRKVGPRERQRSWHNAFLLLFAQPLDELKSLLTGFSYLGSIRTLPPSLYRTPTVPPEEIGVSGEYAAQMLQARRNDFVHYLPPLQLNDNEVTVPELIRQSNLVDGVNDVLQSLGVNTSLDIEDVKDVGFRLLFGRASLQHVGRGLSYLLPVIQLGLITDPLRFTSVADMSLADYRSACPSYAHCALEEPEAHLHPKIQTRLAHWLVSLAMARRQLLIETHSDHLVRRLRGLMARAPASSELEHWLMESVRVLYIDQQNGESNVTIGKLTPGGGLDEWPADFMDEATGEERSIYHAALDKMDGDTAESPETTENARPIEHDVGEEPET